jgi:hypothetical protein
LGIRQAFNVQTWPTHMPLKYSLICDEWEYHAQHFKDSFDCHASVTDAISYLPSRLPFLSSFHR